MRKSIAWLLFAGLCIFPGTASAVVTVYTVEVNFLNALASLGSSTIQESFENDAVWGVARSPQTAASVTSQGITWTTNHPLTNEITTSDGNVKAGAWGVYDSDHGYSTGTVPQCDVTNPPELCFMHDGFSGSIPSPDLIYGVGGYIFGFAGADVDIIIDGIAHNAGALSGTDFRFMGVIDTAGFSSFEYRELEGTVEQRLLIFGDDFTIATSATPPVNNAPVLAAIGDQATDENVALSVPLSASDVDVGDNLSFSMSGEPLGATLNDNDDGTANFIWTPNTGTAGDYPVTFTVTDDGVPAASDSESIIITVIDNIVDVTPPVITLLGDNPMSVEVGSSYVEPGAMATDNLDGDISGSIVIAGTVNTGVAGSYSVTYNVSDAAGNPATEVTRTVNVSASTPGTLQFSAAIYSVSELGGSATITVTRLAGSSGLVGVDYTTGDASATAGSDYTAVSGSLSFADTELSRTFTVPILDDVTYEGDENLNLSLSNPTGGASLGSPASSVLTITEDDPVSTSGSLQFSSSTYTVAENGTTATITVTRDGGSSGAVGVLYASSDASASAGSDYAAVSGSLSFADGVISQSFAVPVLDDTVYEGDETLNLSLSNPTGGAGLGSPATAVLTISEDDPVLPSGSLQFSAPTYTVAEDGTTVTITVTRVGGSSGVVGVDYASSDASATADSDYTAVSGSLSFADGETSRTFTVPILDDVVYEGDETVNLTLSNPTGGAGLGPPSMSSLTIVEDETQTDDGSAGGSSGGSINLITLIVLLSLYRRNFRMKSLMLVTSLRRYQEMKKPM